MIANIALTSFLISHIPILIEVDVEPTGLGNMSAAHVWFVTSHSFVPSETGNNTNDRRGSGLVIESFWHHCGVECSTVVVLVFTHSKVSNFDDFLINKKEMSFRNLQRQCIKCSSGDV